RRGRRGLGLLGRRARRGFPFAWRAVRRSGRLALGGAARDRSGGVHEVRDGVRRAVLVRGGRRQDEQPHRDDRADEQRQQGSSIDPVRGQRERGIHATRTEGVAVVVTVKRPTPGALLRGVFVTLKAAHDYSLAPFIVAPEGVRGEEKNKRGRS